MMENRNRIIRQLWQTAFSNHSASLRTSIFAILDGARNEQIYPAIVESDCEYCCLYRGELSDELAAAAPYLIRLEPQADFTLWLIEQGWGDSWGIFLESEATMEKLRRHFRRFLMVYDEEGKLLYFRFYDPRALRVYLPTCNETELGVIFGDLISRYFVESSDGERLLEYAFVNGELIQC
jgi:hypothetical protein